jgi:MarR family 2-MHQ and catechol resistance regulon transcriptional repressor
MDERTKMYLDSLATHEGRPGFHRPSLEALFQLLTTHDLLMQRCARLAEAHDLTPAGFNILKVLSMAEGKRLPMHRLSNLLLVSRQNITGLVDGLEKRRLVHRDSCCVDRRVKFVQITPVGEALIERALPGHYKDLRDIFSALDGPELAQLGELLTRIRERVGAFDEPERESA